MTKKYSYAYTKSLYDHQYPDEKLISIHERPLADPTGKLTAIIDYEKPLSRHDMDVRFGGVPILARPRTLPSTVQRGMSTEIGNP